MMLPQTSHKFRTLYTASKVTSLSVIAYRPRPHALSLMQICLISIAVVPGLGSASPENWGKSSGEPWLKTLLLNAAPNSSIICFDHGLSSEENFSWQGLVERGTHLLDALLGLR